MALKHRFRLDQRQHSATQLGLVSLRSCIPRSRVALRCRAPSASPLSENNSPGYLPQHAWFGKRQLIPQRLLRRFDIESEQGTVADKRENTVYTVRFSTSYARNSGLDDPLGAVLLCLVGKDGFAFLHRIDCVSDPDRTGQELDAISQIAGKGAVASNTTPKQTAAPNKASAVAKQRFQSGGVDEVCFLGPEMGPLASLLVAPESGSWALDEVDVYSFRTRNTDRFLCRERLGYGGLSAAFLSPVPADSVVYGSGDAAVLLTKEQASALYALGMLSYNDLKVRVTAANIALVASGSFLALALGGFDSATPFAVGGAGGMMYQLLLHRGVDTIPGGSLATQHPALQRASQLLGSAPLRMAFVALLGLGSVWAMQGVGPQDSVEAHNAFELQQLMLGATGFMMFKLALLAVTTLPTTTPEPVLQANSMESDR